MDSSAVSEATDQEIVAVFLRDRSEKSFRALYKRHNPKLLAVARRIASGGPASPEDAIQETWLRATRLLPKFAWQSSLSSWFIGILLNVVHELNRAAGRMVHPDHGDDDDANAVSALEPFESLALVEALRALPPGFRTVVALHDIEGFTHAEIAEALGIDSGTSKSQLARARQRLRSRLVDLQ